MGWPLRGATRLLLLLLLTRVVVVVVASSTRPTKGRLSKQLWLAFPKRLKYLTAASTSFVPLSRRRTTALSAVMNLSRGGSLGDDDDDEEDEEDDDDFESKVGDEKEEEEEEEEVEDEDERGTEASAEDSEDSLVLMVSTSAFSTVRSIVVHTVQAARRALTATFAEEEAAPTDATLTRRVLFFIQRVFTAVFFPDDFDRSDIPFDKQSQQRAKKVSDNDGSDEFPLTDDDYGVGPTSGSRSTPETAQHGDFGTYLSQQYGVRVNSDSGRRTVVYGGSIKDALERAKQQARLLVVVIQALNPSKKKKNAAGDDDDDVAALTAFLSDEVGAVAEQRARKKSPLGSFLLWSAKAGSPEAVTARKRIKGVVQPTGKRPVLLVAYPATAVDRNTGQITTLPRLLAQHHCKPPPTPEKMAAWLKAIRKRHQKQYAALQKQRQEMAWQQERAAGYHGSVQSDIENRKREEQQESERRRRQKEKEEMAEAIRIRRAGLLAALPDEIAASAVNVKTIALRFADGRTGQRRFSSDARVRDVFNWVDAVFAIDRETVILQTMNGQQTFQWSENDSMQKTLDEAGLGKMVGLRVTVKKKSVATENGKEND